MRHRCLTLLSAVLLAGCSTTQLAYDNADWLLQRWAAGLLDPNAAQRTAWKARFGQAMQAHRRELLPEVIALLALLELRDEVERLQKDLLAEESGREEEFQAMRERLARVEERYTWKRYAERLLSLTCIYGFWKFATNLEREETSRYLEMFYHLQFKKRAAAMEVVVVMTMATTMELTTPLTTMKMRQWWNVLKIWRNSMTTCVPSSVTFMSNSTVLRPPLPERTCQRHQSLALLHLQPWHK